MVNEFNPWDVDSITVDEPPFMTLLAEAQAALEAPGATVADVKQRYRKALAAGARHLDAPPTIDAVASTLVSDAETVDAYDDGPFAEGLQCSPLPRPSRPARRRPPPIPRDSAMDRVRRLLGSA